MITGYCVRDEFKVHEYCRGGIKTLQLCKPKQYKSLESSLYFLKQAIAFAHERDIEVYFHWHLPHFTGPMGYPFLSDRFRSLVLKEFILLQGLGLKGIVMHTDFIYPVDLWDMRNTISMDDLLYGHFFNSHNARLTKTKEELEKFVTDCYTWSADALTLFQDDVLTEATKAQVAIDTKVLLENVTTVPAIDNAPGSLEFIHTYLESTVKPTESNHSFYGVCVDLEHYWAVNGEMPIINNSRWDILVHLNCIPDFVTAGSKIDSHGNVTLFECSQFPIETWESYINFLSSYSIPYVREVNYHTFRREQYQLQQYESGK